MVRSLRTLPTRPSLAVLIALTFGLSGADAQHGQLLHSDPVTNGPQVTFSDAVHHHISDHQMQEAQVQEAQVQGEVLDYGVYQPVSEDSVDSLYRSNATRPLGGLFAKGFTRTLTVLGGWNFLNNFDSGVVGTGLVPGGALPAGNFDVDQTGYAISFAFGRRHNHRLRSEIELAIRENDIDALGPPFATAAGSVRNTDETIRAYSVLKNFLFDFKNDSRLTPYVGVGLGWSYLEVESPSRSIDEGAGAFTYQAIGGIATKLNKATDLIVEYRFLGTSAVELDRGSDEVAYDAHNLFLGVKFEY